MYEREGILQPHGEWLQQQYLLGILFPDNPLLPASESEHLGNQGREISSSIPQHIFRHTEKKVSFCNVNAEEVAHIPRANNGALKSSWFNKPGGVPQSCPCTISNKKWKTIPLKKRAGENGVAHRNKRTANESNILRVGTHFPQSFLGEDSDEEGDEEAQEHLSSSMV